MSSVSQSTDHRTSRRSALRRLLPLRGSSSSGADVSAGPRYRARFFLRSTAPLPASYRPFLHVERAKLRWNGDDTFVDHAYPPSLWRPGDVVVLECEVQLDPNFGPGAYDVWFGFFAPGGRLPVIAGPARGDRVHMGTLEVR